MAQAPIAEFELKSSATMPSLISNGTSNAEIDSNNPEVVHVGTIRMDHTDLCGAINEALKRNSVAEERNKVLEDRVAKLETLLKEAKIDVEKSDPPDADEATKEVAQSDDEIKSTDDKHGEKDESQRFDESLELDIRVIDLAGWKEHKSKVTFGSKTEDLKLKHHVIDVITSAPSITSGRPSSGDSSVVRIQIDSKSILAFIDKITNLHLPCPATLIPPYKAIIGIEGQIRAHLDELKQELLARNSDDIKTYHQSADHQSDGEPNGHVVPDLNQLPRGAIETISQDRVQSTVALERNESLASKTSSAIELERNHFEKLVEMMDTHLKSEVQLARDHREGKCTKTKFSHLWHVFRPGDWIASKKDIKTGNIQLMEVVKVSGGRPELESADPYARSKHRNPFEVDAMHVEFDGQSFRPVHTRLRINNFFDPEPIDELDSYPIRYLSAEKQTQYGSDILNRGRKFLSLATAGFHQRQYVGFSANPAKSKQIESKESMEFIDSKVIIDFARSQDVTPHEYCTFTDLTKGPAEELVDFILNAKATDYEEDASLWDDRLYDDEMTKRYMSISNILNDSDLKLRRSEITDQELRLLPGVVSGFVLHTRSFKKLNIDLLQKVEPNPLGFQDLVLPKGHKNLIEALIDRHSTQREGVDKSNIIASGRDGLHSTQLDFGRNKGKGLVLLLHGAPGTGKSSTAETIADYTNKPLLSLSSGDIGSDPTEAQERLEKWFELAYRWNCVMLIDEADVFIARRRREDLKRNAIVSIFLRTLEYFRGILFLTTNRVGDIDEAFKSRIHVSLYYDFLDKKTTLSIWQVNINRVQSRVNLDEKELREWAKDHYIRKGKPDSSIPKEKQGEPRKKRWNGRQIYNAFQTAVALAEYEAEREQKGYPGLSRHNSIADQLDSPETIRETIKPTLKTSYFDQVDNTYSKFEQYLHETYKGDDHYAIEQLRHDGYVDRQDRLQDAPRSNRRTKRSIKSRKVESESEESEESEESDAVDGADDSEEPSDKGTEEESEDSEEERKRRKKKSKKSDKSDKGKRRSRD